MSLFGCQFRARRQYKLPVGDIKNSFTIASINGEEGPSPQRSRYLQTGGK